ncbi:MAG: hypothetical protein EON54_24375 [Alcaligenaceae bacterium]|nr:MAG: hypothetical protein EON54_24375 [Alcaligenaceae bacterium]
MAKARATVALLWALATACASAAGNLQEESSQSSSPCNKKPAAPRRGTGYDDKPVDACLGPQHYRIPANYFRDQIGPDFQGNFSLTVQWPDLQPIPPGERETQEWAQQIKHVAVSPYYVDRVPIETRLDSSIEARRTDPYYRDDDPEERLDLRVRQPERFGLTPYYVDPAKFWAFFERRSRINGHPVRARLENTRDWYLGHDAQGRLTTVIKCDSHVEVDGLAVQGDRLVEDGARRFPGCTQEIVMVESKLLITIDYRRVLLHDWKRFEDRTRQLFTQYRVR